jgi:hypothetical protein
LEGGEVLENERFEALENFLEASELKIFGGHGLIILRLGGVIFSRRIS